MAEFKAQAPGVKTFATVGEAAGFAALYVLGLGESHRPESQWYQLPVVAPGDTPGFITTARGIDQEVAFWTIDSAAEFERLVDIDCGGVMTNNATMGSDILRRQLAKRRRKAAYVPRDQRH